MLNHILTASPEELQAEAERISLLDEPDREEAILELLEEIQFKQELLVWYESEDGPSADKMDYEEVGYDYESSEDEDTMDPDTYEREDNSMELADDPYSV